MEDQREYVACLKCTNDCYLSAAHALSSTRPLNLTTAPSFLKVLDHEAHKHLEIPQYFVDKYLSKCSGSAKLEGPSGWVWYAPFVRSRDVDNRCNLAFGSLWWDDFARDHGLQDGDLLVFTYYGSRQLFKVRIFDPLEGIEKSQHCLPTKPYFVDVPASKPVEEKDVQDGCVSNGINRAADIKKAQSSGDGNKLRDKIRDCVSQQTSSNGGVPEGNGDHKVTKNNVSTHDACETGQPKKISCICSSDVTVMNNNGSTHDSPHDTCNMGQPKNMSCSCCNGIACCNGEIKTNIKNLSKGVSDKPYDSMHDISAPRVETLLPSKRTIDERTVQKFLPASSEHNNPRKSLTYPRKRRFLSNGYNPYAVASPSERERVIREANAFHSKNPFTIKRLPASSIYKDRKLLLPSAFVNEIMLTRNAVMTWVDDKRKEWRFQWLAKRGCDNRISFVSGGWAAFVVGHRLIEHDILILELINRATLRFHVHIFKQMPSGDDGRSMSPRSHLLCEQPHADSDNEHSNM